MAIRAVKGKEDVWDVVVYDRVTKQGEKPRAVWRRVHGSRKDAAAKERALLHARDKGQRISERITLEEYAKSEWLPSKDERAAQTRRNYEDTLDRYILPTLGERPVQAIRAAHIRALYRALKDDGLSGTTRHGVHVVLRMVLALAVVDKIIAENPSDVVTAPEVDTAEAQHLAPEDVRDFLAAVRSTKIGTPALILYAAALRRQELVALRWQDVDLDAGTLRVEFAAEQVNGAVGLKEPKSERSKRTVALNPAAVAALKEYRRAQLELRARMANYWRDEGFVFPSTLATKNHTAGGLWTPRAFSHAWRKVVRDTEWQHVHPHLLRHTAITHWLQGGIRDEVVSRAAGHSSSTVTKTIYSHILDRELAETAAVAERVLSGE